MAQATQKEQQEMDSRYWEDYRDYGPYPGVSATRITAEVFAAVAPHLSGHLREAHELLVGRYVGEICGVWRSAGEHEDVAELRGQVGRLLCERDRERAEARDRLLEFEELEDRRLRRAQESFGG